MLQPRRFYWLNHYFFWRLYKTLLLGNSRRAKYHLPKKLVHSSPMKTGDCLFCLRFFQQHIIYSVFNPLSASFTKWSSTLKQFVGRLPTNCLSVFDHFVGLALKGLTVVINAVHIWLKQQQLLLLLISFSIVF